MRRFLIAGPTLALAAVLAAGCGGEAAGEEVATVQGTQANPSASASPGASDPDQARKFAQCMRDNGVPDFPDPGPDGRFGQGMLGGGGNIDRTKIQSALQACQDLAPNGGERRELNPAQQEQLRQWAQCMRDNGVDVPDPDPNGGLFGNGGLNFDPDDPAFQKAMEACQDKISSFREGAGT
jgi:hypothetical protein